MCFTGFTCVVLQKHTQLIKMPWLHLAVASNYHFEIIALKYTNIAQKCTFYL